jgi:hypothetical protein
MKAISEWISFAAFFARQELLAENGWAILTSKSEAV